MNDYETVVGLEIHVELSTITKMFCSCKTPTLQDKPNTRTCPVCLGLPGALPIPNLQAIEDCVKIGLALNCTINRNSFFERKNYFYPDLAKGFQTSQFLLPFGEKGYLDITVNGSPKRVGITRVHMEEDTGKLTHSSVNGREVSLIDFNRSGVPLVEIVTEPDIRSGEEAKVFLTELQKIIRYVGASDADMEKGHMRLEPNISLRNPGETSLPNYKVEVKNINSFRFVEKAIHYEQKRHKELLDKGETPTQETRGWNEFKNRTVSQRSKEEAHDYRYFPEPDIPPVTISDEQLDRLSKAIPELSQAKTKRLIDDLGLTPYNAEILSRDSETAQFFEDALEAGKPENINATTIANFMINKKIDIKKTTPSNFIKTIINQSSLVKIDQSVLEAAISKVLKENPDAVKSYKDGKTQILGFLIGQTKKVLPDANDTDQIRNKLQEMLQ